MTDYTVLYLIFSEQKIGLWSFLSLKDVLNLSISVSMNIIYLLFISSKIAISFL